ncbi:hypothetical protein OAO87_01875 [bacterium]|nr:hypothetical protein [bacterium]
MAYAARRASLRRASTAKARVGAATEHATLDTRAPWEPSGLDASMLGAWRSTLDARRSTLDARCSMLDARRSMLDARVFLSL